VIKKRALPNRLAGEVPKLYTYRVFKLSLAIRKNEAALNEEFINIFIFYFIFPFKISHFFPFTNKGLDIPINNINKI